MRLSNFVSNETLRRMQEVAENREIAAGARRFEELQHRHRKLELAKAADRNFRKAQFEQAAGHTKDGKVIRPAKRF